jgi:hypothetical protein
MQELNQSQPDNEKDATAIMMIIKPSRYEDPVLETKPISTNVKYLTGDKIPMKLPPPRCYEQEAHNIYQLYRDGIQIGADGSIIRDGDAVMNRITLRLAQIDHFYGCHEIVITNASHPFETVISAPIAEVNASTWFEDDCWFEESWFAHDMILTVGALHTYVDDRRQMYDPYHKSAQYVGPVVRAIRLIQKRYHERHAERLTQANIIEANRENRT